MVLPRPGHLASPSQPLQPARRLRRSRAPRRRGRVGPLPRAGAVPTTAKTRGRRIPGSVRAARRACLSRRRPTRRIGARQRLPSASGLIRATRLPDGRPGAAGASRMPARCKSCSTSSPWLSCLPRLATRCGDGFSPKKQATRSRHEPFAHAFLFFLYESGQQGTWCPNRSSRQHGALLGARCWPRVPALSS